MLGSGLVNSLARPDGNTTGVSILVFEAEGKRQDILIEAVPGLRLMAVLIDVSYAKTAKLDALQDAARKHNVEFSVHRVARGEEIAPVGYVSLDGTFVGLSWISDELFGKPSGEVHPGRLARNHRLRYRPNKMNLQRPEKSSVKEPKDAPPRTVTTPESENAVEDSQPFASSDVDPKTGLNISEKVTDEVPIPHASAQ